MLPRNRLKASLLDGGVLYAVLTGMGICSILLAAMWSNGGTLQAVFSFDLRDTGMDFFNSLAETRGAVPYTAYETLYPPLANLFFYLLQLCVPRNVAAQWAGTHAEVVAMRGTDLDLRSHQAPMLLFLIYIVIVTILMLEVVERSLKNENTHAKLIAVASVFCCGNLFAIERGNIITLSFIFSLFFLANYNSERPVLRELALLSLAVAAGLKLYPALLGIVLLEERQWKRAIRTILYGILLFVGPFFFFGGLEAIKIFFRVLTGFEQSEAGSFVNYGIYGVVATFFAVMSNRTGISCEYIGVTAAIVKVLLGAVLIFDYCTSSEKWEKHLILTLAMVFYQKSVNYTLIFFLLPFVSFLKENPYVTKKNGVYYLFFMLVLVPYVKPMLRAWYSLHSAMILLSLYGLTAYITFVRLYRLIRKKADGKEAMSPI